MHDALEVTDELARGWGGGSGAGGRGGDTRRRVRGWRPKTVTSYELRLRARGQGW